MQDSQTEFVQLLKKQRLVKSAADYCASWQNSYIARNYDGWVYIHNGPIRPDEFAWCHSAHHWAGYDRYPMTSMDVAGDWREHYLPLSALQLPQPAVSPGQAAFLERLLAAGVAEPSKAFVDAWKNNAWISMDMEGTVWMFNCLPSKLMGTWVTHGHDIEWQYALGVIENHTLDWEQCLVNFSERKPPPLPAIKIELNSANRMDCWI